ncbi:hypothetical protein SLEP1_g28334 [Rubroshorea leprosula]|uniref:C3H1-type domain-containing protein n=1 Tax=Rubroshorea leprosula TaxID=152421 RepID=A0AAV5K2Q6_9ROSI|nr:hypothetical protein SLEP1_g28334 [Rubroshorea leprosula]
MRGSNKSKRVSWASDVNLCQVRLFLSEESPSQVGSGAQDHLQAKTSWVSHPTGATTEDVLPPGFEGANSATWLQIKLADIPVIKWKCPPTFLLEANWQVVAGEESKQVEIENQRGMRMLEAVYPRPSAIPPNPSVSADVKNECHNDQQAALIPITPVEDEDAALETPSNFIAPFGVSVSSQPPQLLAPGISPPHCSMPGFSNEKPTTGMALNVESSVVAAAFTAITKGNEQGNMIDHDLLIKILGDPKLIEKLITDYGPASSAQNFLKSALPSVPASNIQAPATSSDPSPVHFNRTENTAPSLTSSSSGSFYTQPNGAGVGALPIARAPVPGVPPVLSPPTVVPSRTKDVNYYKNLIQQHGGERQERAQQFGGRYNHQPGANQELVNNPKSRDLRPKIMKPCIYFNSSRGCRNGANCAYQHDASSQQRGNGIPEVPNAKRMKMDREISS